MGQEKHILGLAHIIKIKEVTRMQTNRFLLILPLIAVVVLASGCTLPFGGGGSTGLGNGVVILAFVPDFASVQSGEPVQLQVKVQNQCELLAKNTRAELTQIDVSQWGGSFGSSFTSVTFGDLLPFDKETGTQGAIKSKIWSLTAPDQAKGITQNYQAAVKVSYDYKTSAQKLITIVDDAELRRILDAGSTLPGQPSTASAGPLTVAITTGNFERTTAQQFGFDNVFPIQITIRNTGGGSVVPPGTGTGFYGGEWSGFGDVINYPIGVRVTPPAGTTFVNLGSSFGADDCSTGTITVDMWKNQDKTITCELQVTNPPTYREDRALSVDVFYRYQIEASTNIQVFGRDTAFGGGWNSYGW